MNLKTNTLKKDELVLISSGCFSDYQIKTICRAVEDMDLTPLLGEFEAIVRRPTDSSYDLHDRFVRWLVNTKKVLIEVPCREVHIGDYDAINLDVSDVK